MTVKCQCGRTELLVQDGMTVTSLRCALCPPARPRLRLVKA